MSLLWACLLQFERVTLNTFCFFAPKSTRCSSQFCFSISCRIASSQWWQEERKKLFFYVLWFRFSNPCWVSSRVLPWTCTNLSTWFIIQWMYGVTLSDWSTSTKSRPPLPCCLFILPDNSCWQFASFKKNCVNVRVVQTIGVVVFGHIQQNLLMVVGFQC